MRLVSSFLAGAKSPSRGQLFVFISAQSDPKWNFFSPAEFLGTLLSSFGQPVLAGSIIGETMGYFSLVNQVTETTFELIYRKIRLHTYSYERSSHIVSDNQAARITAVDMTDDACFHAS